MKKEIIVLLITLLILPTILAETISDESQTSIQLNQELPDMEPSSTSLDASPACYSAKFNVLKNQMLESTLGIIFLLAIIDLVLKGFAMWRAAKKDHKIWFIIFLIFNTIGILPLIYLIITRKKTSKKQ